MKSKLHSVCGFACGVAGTIAYLVSCSDSAMNVSQGGTAGSADQVTYSGARSGLRGTSLADGLAWRLTISDAGRTMSLDDGAAFLVLTKS